MDEPSSDGTSENRRKGPGKRATGAVEPLASITLLTSTAPCGACKFLRRKCISGCIFAPHYGSDQGAARFAAVHKVFGASNVSKLLLHIPANRRHDAVVTITYEAQARLSDPVYGCVSTILALQQQVASLQAELAVVQTQLINNRYAMENALQTSQQQHHLQQQQLHQEHNIAILQPTYSNNSSVSNNNLINNINSANTFNSTAFDQLPDDTCATNVPNNSPSFDPIHQEDEEDEESHNSIAFTNQMFH
ncbi:LOB domain-containing protein 20-like [Nicotiana tabacum]|uniref:LOB domain-containing protein 20-like n=1 Tax=Nicotiana tabacum TaxID=4097 RepID=A0A1S4DBV1_TOBAC|nr:PREDICTED: LOB domain-containing protein 20-like [Nicotiana tabacum]